MLKYIMMQLNAVCYQSQLIFFLMTINSHMKAVFQIMAESQITARDEASMNEKREFSSHFSIALIHQYSSTIVTCYTHLSAALSFSF